MGQEDILQIVKRLTALEHLSERTALGEAPLSTVLARIIGTPTTGRVVEWASASDLQESTLIKSGAGVLTLSAGGAYTLTIPKTGTAAVGTGTTGHIAEWVTDANTLQASTLVKSGAGVLTLSAGGAYTLTIPKTGTAPVGTGTTGRVAEWVTDANTLQASALIKSGAGVLTLSAGGGYTLTVPESLIAAGRDVAQTFSLTQTLTLAPIFTALNGIIRGNGASAATALSLPLAVANGGTGVTARPTFFVHKNASPQGSITDGAYTKLTWSTETFDTNGNFASSTFTPTIAGKYLLYLAALFVAGADQTEIAAAIYKEGAQVAAQSIRCSGAAGQSVSVMAILDANGSTDDFEAYVYNGTGATAAISGDASLTYFCGGLIG